MRGIEEKCIYVSGQEFLWKKKKCENPNKITNIKRKKKEFTHSIS